MSGMYESPIKRRLREAVQEAETGNELKGELLELIDTDPAVRAALLRLLAGTRRQPRPTTTPIRGGKR